MVMNHYGAMALRHWENLRPQELATIEDPQQFFSELGEQVAAEVQRRATALEGSVGEDYLANLGMLTEARTTAEAEVLREMVFTEPETTTS
jgi:hypothetical protein